MYKLIIVDDEIWVRKRLIQTINWAALSITDVYEASNGLDALNIAIEVEPDIVITDIGMDKMNGIELMQALNDSSLNPQLIVISGYSDFTYAQQSIKNGVSEYILKPIDEAELICAVQRCLDKIVKTNNYSQTHEFFDYYKENHTKSMLEGLLIDTLDGKIKTSASCNNRLRYIDASLADMHLTCVVFNVEQSSLSGFDAKLLAFAVENILSKNIHIGKMRIIFPYCGVFACMILTNNEDHDRLELAEACQVAKDYFFENTGYEMLYGIGDTVNSILDIKKTFLDAMEDLKNSAEKDKKHIISSKAQPLFSAGYSSFNINQIIDSIEKCDRKGCISRIDALISELSETKQAFPINVIYLMIINDLIEYVYTSKSLDDSIITSLLDALIKSSGIHDSAAMRASLISLADNFFNFTAEKKHYIVEQAIVYIEANYATIKSQKQVSEQFYINNSYFCRLFKEKTGSSFTEFLTKTRIKEAKELILSTTLKLYEIAEKVGYNNFHYFSSVFKKIEGVSPNSLRRGTSE